MMKLISKNVTKTLGLIAFTGVAGLMSAQTMNWSLAGPVYNAGRARNIVVDKADASGNTIYVGSTSSGVFKTTDGGANWNPLDDQGIIKNISYMAQGTDNTIYASTGEGFLRTGQAAKAQPGTGLYKLNGTSLVPVGDADSTNVGHTITRIACSPANANVIALATNKGIYVTNDGSHFTQITAGMGIPTTANSIYGMDVKFDGNGILYCSVGNEHGGGSLDNIAGNVYRSSDNTLSSFSTITPSSSVLGNVNYGRIELAIAPSNNNVIYASCAHKSNNYTNGATLLGLYASYDAGSTWTMLRQGPSPLDPLTDGATIASGDYAHVITVNPSNSDELFIGSYGFYIFFKTGGTTTNPTSILFQLGSNLLPNTQYYLHENIHDIKLVGSNPTKFYFVTDAGIYRSSDLSAATSQTLPPSFQPFYKGLVTGQFNSVSIETFPAGINTGTANGSLIDPAAGFIGGTGGNGLNYFSGTPSQVTQETNYLTGEVYNCEYSKILSEAAILSVSNGNLYRTTDARSSQPTLMGFNTYSNSLSNITPANNSFNVGGTSTGSQFRLWENHGQANGANDPLLFYNDTSRVQAPGMVGVAQLTTQTNFTFSVPRPNPAALIDSIVIRTATVTLPISGPSASVATTFSNAQTVLIKLANSYPTTTATTIPPITSSIGAISNASVMLDAVAQTDQISVTFNTAPFASYTIPYYPPPPSPSAAATVPDAAAYYRVFATVFYRYKAGDVVSVVDNNISTRTTTYSAVLSQPLKWAYGSTLNSYTMSANTSTALPALANPTYVLVSSASNQTSVSQSSPVFTVQPITTTSYTISAYGNYALTAQTVTYVLAANTDTTMPGTTYSFVLNPGNITSTLAATSGTSQVIFNVTPSVTTTYTITQSNNSNTLTSNTYSTVNTPTYVLNPGNVSQSDPHFTVTVPVGSTVTAYTLTGMGSAGSTSTSITYPALPVNTFSTQSISSVPFSQNNPYVKIPTTYSAKLALIFNHPKVTNGLDAVVVARAPLSLNEPLNFVRLSQSGCMTTLPNGSPDPNPTHTITVSGSPTLLQWSNAGTELYYATSTNSLYRVSFINLIMDFSSGSYYGKLNTDIFNYAGGVNGTGGPNNGPNLNSPYRTTLIGSFNKRITSISISKNDDAMLLTFDDPTGGNLVQYTDSLKASLTSHIVFTSKTTPALKTLDNKTLKLYCSLLENHNPKQAFLGTDNGVFYTADITSSTPTWSNANNNQLPVVQVYDIKQQTMTSGECYNSGEIYVATYGRGVWTNSSFRTTGDFSYVGIKEQQLQEKNISIFPNPTSGDVTVSFNGVDGETASIHVMDISGRIIKSENLGKLTGGETDHTLETSSLNSGIYLINVVSSNGIKRTAKLIVTK